MLNIAVKDKNGMRKQQMSIDGASQEECDLVNNMV